jgi:hypothetical protein
MSSDDMDTVIQSQTEVTNSEPNATVAAENLEPQIQQPAAEETTPLPNPAFRRPNGIASSSPRPKSSVVESPASASDSSQPKVQRISHKDHMIWMREISTQIRDHYQQKTGNKMPKPVSHQLFNRDMGTWFSSRQKEQGESANLEAIDPHPFDPQRVDE